MPPELPPAIVDLQRQLAQQAEDIRRLIERVEELERQVKTKGD